MHNRRPSRVIRSAGLAAAVLLLAGCADRADTAGGTATAAAVTTAATAAGAASGSAAAHDTTSAAAPSAEDAADVSPFLADTSPDRADPVAPDRLTVTTVRAAHHDGFDRVVFELSGSGTPGWSAEYVDTPTSQGSGEAVDVPGSAHLQVTLQGTSYPFDSGATEQARGAVGVGDAAVVQGVFYDATFEGTSIAWVGTSAEKPFRVYALTGPSRVVVEVADAG